MASSVRGSNLGHVRKEAGADSRKQLAVAAREEQRDTEAKGPLLKEGSSKMR